MPRSVAATSPTLRRSIAATAVVGLIATILALVGPGVSPAAAETIHPGPPPVPCTFSPSRSSVWPDIRDQQADQRPCYWDRMYQSGTLWRLDGGPREMRDGSVTTLTPEWAGPDEAHGFTSPPPPSMIGEGSFRLRFNYSPSFPYDINPFLRSADGRAANRTIGYDDVFVIPPTWDMSGCERPPDATYRWFVEHCTVRLIKGPYYDTPAGEPVPWMLFTGALFKNGIGDSMADVPMMTNCSVQCPGPPRYWGQSRYAEIPVYIEPSPYAIFETSDLGHRTYRFDGATSLYNGTIDSYEWSFGDGETATGAVVEHTFAREGGTTVTLTVRAGGQTGTAVRTFEVEKPKQIALAPIEVTNTTPDLDEMITATYRLTNTGETPITDAEIRFTAEPDGAASWGSPRPASVDLDPGATATIRQDYWPQELPFTLEATADGTADGAGVSSETRSIRIGSVDLRVALHLSETNVDLDPDGDGNLSPQPVTATAEVTNPTADDLEDIVLELPQLDTSDSPAPVVIGDPIPDLQLGTLAAGESTSRDFVLTAQHRGTTDVRVGATVQGGSAAGASDFDLGTIEVTGEQPVSFTWSMRDRYSKGSDAATSRATGDPKSFTIEVDYLVDGTCPSGDTALAWKADGVVVTPSADTVIDCRVTLVRPDLTPFELQLEARQDGDLVGRATERLEPRDIVVVAVGDSMSSGEGNPETTGPLWSNDPCHRSSKAGSAIAARLLEDDANPDTVSDRHSSVTFVHLACSGATTTAGLLATFDGVTHAGFEAPQLLAIRTIIGDRDVDHLFMTAGINDIEFIGLVEVCISGVFTPCDLPSARYKGMPLPAYLDQAFATLSDSYDDVADALGDLNIPSDRVSIIEYPDPSRDTQGNFCSYLGIDSSEMQFLYDEMMSPLNDAGAGAAGRHNWNRVSGVDSGFRGHGLCGSAPWMIGVAQSKWRQGNVNGGFHPNASGHALIAEQVFSSLDPDKGGTGKRVAWSYPSLRSRAAKGTSKIDLARAFPKGTKLTLGPGSTRAETFTVTATSTTTERTAAGASSAATEAVITTYTLDRKLLYDHDADELVAVTSDLAGALTDDRLFSSVGPNRFTGVGLLHEQTFGGSRAIWYDPPAGVRPARVRFLVDGVAVSQDTAAPYDLVPKSTATVAGFDTTVLADGYHTVDAVATDSAGRELHRETGEFLTTNAAAVRTLRFSTKTNRSGSVPLAGRTVAKGSAFVFLGPSATSAIVGLGPVEFVLDGKVLDTDTAGPYDVGDGGTATAAPRALPAAARTKGNHTLVARLKTKAGGYLEIGRAAYKAA